MSTARGLLVAGALGALIVTGARAADFDAVVSTVTAAPGATVDIPLTVNPAPNGFGILGIQLRLDLGASVVQSASFVPVDGWLWTWGAPAQNANVGFAAAATAGVSPVTDTGTRLATVRVVVRSDAVAGTDLPLVLSTLRFNEGTPSVSVANGVLRVRTGGLDAPAERTEFVALAAPWPNPARRSARFAFSLARAEADARLGVYAADGRLVRLLASGPAIAGRHETEWNLDDGDRQRVAAGLYFVRLRAGSISRLQRLVVIH